MRHVSLILQESVPRLGEAGDLVKVKVGFARNFLVPQGKAVIATQVNVKELEHQKRVVAGRVTKELKDLGAVKDRLGKVRRDTALSMLDRHGLRYPEINLGLWRTYFQRLREDGFLDDAPRSNQGAD